MFLEMYRKALRALPKKDLFLFLLRILGDLGGQEAAAAVLAALAGCSGEDLREIRRGSDRQRLQLGRYSSLKISATSASSAAALAAFNSDLYL